MAKPEVMRPHEKSRPKWEDEAERRTLKVVDWIHLRHDRDSCKRWKRPSVSIKCEQFLVYLSNDYLVQRKSAAQSRDFYGHKEWTAVGRRCKALSGDITSRIFLHISMK